MVKLCGGCEAWVLDCLEGLRGESNGDYLTLNQVYIEEDMGIN